VIAPPLPADRPGSTRGGRFSDESLRIRDVQFDRPEIRIEFRLRFEEITPGRLIEGSIRGYVSPMVGEVGVELPFQNRRDPALFADQQGDGAAIRIAAAD
jgi:hypothetical protein